MFGTTRYIREIAELRSLRLTVWRVVRSGIFAEFHARAVLFTLGGIAGKEVINLRPVGLVIPCTLVLQRVNPGSSEEKKSVECLQVPPDFRLIIAYLHFASFCFLLPLLVILRTILVVLCSGWLFFPFGIYCFADLNHTSVGSIFYFTSRFFKFKTLKFSFVSDPRTSYFMLLILSSCTEC